MLFSKKTMLLIMTASLCTSGCSTLNNMKDSLTSKRQDRSTIKQYLKDPRNNSIYDTSGFAYTPEEALQKANQNAAVVCQGNNVQVLSKSPRSFKLKRNNAKNVVYVLDMTYRCRT